ncbi:hypothetical protein OAI07_02330, partial [Akkermansiaceae bacterium]|nr:hypothetical protein [Akkermansiaceae bacterium]
IAKLRAIATHNRYVHDFCSYRGLFIMSGVDTSHNDNKHIIKSDDAKAAVWAGTIDDIWTLGKPVGKGGPWLNTSVKANTPSDPYLLTGYDKKSLTLSSSQAATITAQIDLTGTGIWANYKSFELKTDEEISYTFPIEFQAYWIRFSASSDTEANAQLIYQ